MVQRVQAGMAVAVGVCRSRTATSAAVTTVTIMDMGWCMAGSVGGAIPILILTIGSQVITTVLLITVLRQNRETRLIHRPGFRTRN